THCIEMRPLRFRDQAERAHLANYFTEHRIGIGEMGDRASRATRYGRQSRQRENRGWDTEKRWVPIGSFGTHHTTIARRRDDHQSLDRGAITVGIRVPGFP